MGFYSNSQCLSLIFLFLYVRFPLLQVHASGNNTDHLSLLKFQQWITSDPRGLFNSWNSSLSFCSWSGITCSRRHQRVISLNLSGQKLVGTISPYIGNLSFLRILNLENNNFRGHIPQEVDNLFRLQHFLVNNNSLSGEIPSNLSRCNQLQIIDLSVNQVEGRIPSELGNLEKLDMLLLSVNKIGGEIPPSLTNLSSLTRFALARNELVGEIPADMGRLKSLKFFSVGANHLSGTVPPSFFNISSIVFISTADNQLNGSIPETVGLTLPNLQKVYMGLNEFSGFLPYSFSNASYLRILDISTNKFEGEVPNFGSHPDLLWLDLSDNDLGTNSSTDLMFLKSLRNSTNLQILGLSYNNFGGVLPNSMANLSIDLNRLYLGGNQFTGMIPAALGSFINLIVVGMEFNLLTGVIPSYLGKLRKLLGLNLWGNEFSGEIPSSFGNLTQLSQLILSQNQLKGIIPASIGNCTSLNFLYLSQNNLEGHIPEELMVLPSLSILLSLEHNSLSGNLPAQVGKLINLNKLDVSENKLSGEIPTAIGDCSALAYLYMQGNSFEGAIPSSVASLRGLQHLDLSRNNLTGEIPKDLQNLPFLQYLNLSFNDLQGEVPTGRAFGNASALSLIGNPKLCGGIPQLLLPKCLSKPTKKGKSDALKIAIIVSSTCVLLGVLSLLAYRRRKSRSSSSSATPSLMDLHVKVSYQDLHNATSGFSSEYLIGSGGFGYVYKGYLNQIGRAVAIKVLKLHQKDAFKTLMAECSVLKNVRHRNLVKILSYCSSIDYSRNEFKALKFMENGSLDGWLHHDNDSGNQPRYLNFLERLNIAIDVASALHYLHDLYERSIIHCDLKPSNVLLDKNMVAHLSDFGLAKFLSITNDDSRSQSSAIGIKGTIGYSPPESGMGTRASKEGDVYSYGILVLEMFSGKRPTDLMFKDNLNLHNFVRNSLPNKVDQIVDETLIFNQMEETPALISVFEVGIACSRESPQERMKMEDTVKQLDSIRTGLHK
ncbi:putative receptor-like protein kinase At3g47110 [Euphorbia lathyris]|uniref:putative receptor-like protein kinase At3g47110 n=1 Tax=Euphorbia lathyris TaxID=212925 RepID=UPI0033134FE5